jgi:ubiquinone/menaquinone biosynthesis C-methylase UbiE
MATLPIEKQNLGTYSAQEVIDFYDASQKMELPEKTIFEILKPELSGMTMLDVGVGGGRTTVFFAPHVKSYTAIDYSAGMIERCQPKFAKQFPEAKFFVGDARDLSRFGRASFDFVLFSLNGVDYIPGTSRSEFFRQARTVLKPGGYLSFSTHNLGFLKRLKIFSSVHVRINVFAMLKKMAHIRNLQRMNAEALRAAKTSDYVFINDGVHNGGLAQCYVRTQFQVGTLRECGFTDIRVFSSETGNEYLGQDAWLSAQDPWLYYLCK